MKRRFFFLAFLFLALSLPLAGCRREPAVSFPAEVSFRAEGTLFQTEVTAEAVLSATGESRLTLLSPESLAGMTFLCREDGRVFAVRDGQTVQLPGGHPVFSLFAELTGDRGTPPSPVREGDGWLLREKTAAGTYAAQLSGEGRPLSLSGPDFSLRVTEVLP